ncbi:PREDICTED: glutathione S-transferase T2-like [Brassica oleracea var. oleracea]|uniref:glutathione S-transferase T2-like n=1 Tax=Brassica oleracea var. oleracea TaxID=109376 RepID=UPI0006A71DC4|nr:PREDICTED: glutathione S-transferase T2-like [Brassica oleracea var. oleracea]
MASVPPPARGKDNVQSQGLVSGDLHQLQHGKAPPSGSFDTEASNFDGDTAVERRERHKWIPEDDILLISSWLNTSKDVMVGNEQRSDAFWSRIAAYFDASRESEATAATKEKRSGQNDNDVLKLAHQIFYHNHHKKFTLEHAWKELRNDQKWCNLATAKHLSSKKRKCEDAANASSKKKVAEENSLNGFQSMWTIKQQDLLIKERLSKMSLLDSLLGKKEPLAEHEEALKKKLIDDLISS